jgi:hypothetical protein
MESANRAYVQQTLNRLKEIATGNAPALPAVEATKKTTPKKASKASSSKKSVAAKTSAKKETSSSTTLSKSNKQPEKGKTKETRKK